MLFIMRTEVKTSMGYLKYLTWSVRKKKKIWLVYAQPLDYNPKLSTTFKSTQSSILYVNNKINNSWIVFKYN